MARQNSPLLLVLVMIFIVLLGVILFSVAFNLINEKDSSAKKLNLPAEINLNLPSFHSPQNYPQDYVNFAKTSSSSDDDDDDDEELECVLDSDCDDGDASTSDSCVSGACENIETPQCNVDLDCDDGDLLTADSCEEGYCQYEYLGDCYIDSDCSDGNLNTQDRCIAGYCSFTLIGGCTSNIQCADGNPLTNDVCTNNICQNNFIGECLNNFDCDDGDIFTEDLCVAYFCEYNFLGDCFVDADCDDGNIFTNDVCEADRICSNNVIDTTEDGFTACDDGLDNDVDGLIDGEDSDCVDLTISNFVLMFPLNPTVGSMVFVSFDVTNNGYVDMPGIEWELDFGFGGFRQYGTTMPLTIGASGEGSGYFVYTVAEDYTLTATADYNDAISESNELNNLRTLDITVI